MKIKVVLLCFLVVASLQGIIIWSPRTNMPTGRDGLGIGVVNDTVYCIGGWTAGLPGTATGIVEAYDPVSDSWVTKAPMPTPRGFLAVCVLNNKIYALGGWNASSSGLTTAEVYDPATDTWSSLTPMQTGRNGLGAEAANGKIYAIGGFLNETAVVEEYDTLINAWIYKTSMPTTRFFFASEVVDDKIYVMAGRSAGVNLGPTYVYDPIADNWQTAASIPTPRYHPEAGAAGGTIYVCGGLTDSDLICGSSKDTRAEVAIVESYDPYNDIWSVEEPMLTARRELDVGVIQSTFDYLYAIGGWPSPVSNINEEGYIYIGIEEDNKKATPEIRNLAPTILTGPLYLPDTKVCRVFNITGCEVEPDDLARGIFFIEVDGVISRKVIKIR